MSTRCCLQFTTADERGQAVNLRLVYDVALILLEYIRIARKRVKTSSTIRGDATDIAAHLE
jgi:hypothetical protein